MTGLEYAGVSGPQNYVLSQSRDVSAAETSLSSILERASLWDVGEQIHG